MNFGPRPHGLLLSQGSLKAGKVVDGFVFDEPWQSWAADGRLESSRSQHERSVMFFFMCFNINAINIYIYEERERERKRD